MSDMPTNACERFRLDGRVCFLSGATGHLGHAMAEALATAGAHVLVNARTEDAVNALVSDLHSSGGKASAVCFDVANQSAVNSAVEQIRRQHGRLDVIVNNASSGRSGTFDNMTAADFEQVYRVNV